MYIGYLVEVALFECLVFRADEYDIPLRVFGGDGSDDSVIEAAGVQGAHIADDGAGEPLDVHRWGVKSRGVKGLQVASLSDVKGVLVYGPGIFREIGRIGYYDIGLSDEFGFEYAGMFFPIVEALQEIAHVIDIQGGAEQFFEIKAVVGVVVV